MRVLMDRTTEHVKAKAPADSHELVELIFTQPYCRIANLVWPASRSVRRQRSTSKSWWTLAFCASKGAGKNSSSTRA